MNTTQTKSPARTELEAMIESKDTATLMAAHFAIESQATKDAAERLTAALIADCIEKRHNLNDAMNAVFMDEDYDGTYHEALLMAFVITGASF